MKEWIEKNLHPPGMTKKNRGALFSLIGKVFGIVRDDALIAFNAHFPYLADEQKLAEHGKALSIPRFVFDSDQEYRDRVTAASFYHMKTGERGYIKSQLAAHFGDRFLTKEEFLQIYLQVLDLTDDEIAWAQDFLDAIVDPNVSLQFGKWKRFIDRSRIKENWDIQIRNKNIEAVLLNAATDIRLNLMFKETIGRSIRYNGQYEYDGTIEYKQNPGFYDLVRIAVTPHNIDRVYHGETVSVNLKLLFADNLSKEIRYNGKYQYDGTIDYYSDEPIADRFSAKMNLKLQDAGKLADRVTGDITLQPIVNTMKAADRVTGGVTLQPADTMKTADRVTGDLILQPIANIIKAGDQVTSNIALQQKDTAGIKSKLAIKVQRDIEYNGDISYDGSYGYDGYIIEEVL
jgi:hypothetical protein